MLSFKNFLIEKTQQEKDDENENILYYLAENKYRSITKGEIIEELKDDYVKMLSGRTEIIRWKGVTTQKFKDMEKLKEYLKKIEYWEHNLTNSGKDKMDELMKKIYSFRKNKNIK